MFDCTVNAWPTSTAAPALMEALATLLRTPNVKAAEPSNWFGLAAGAAWPGVAADCVRVEFACTLGRSLTVAMTLIAPATATPAVCTALGSPTRTVATCVSYSMAAEADRSNGAFLMSWPPMSAP